MKSTTPTADIAAALDGLDGVRYQEAGPHRMVRVGDVWDASRDLADPPFRVAGLDIVTSRWCEPADSAKNALLTTIVDAVAGKLGAQAATRGVRRHTQLPAGDFWVVRVEFF